MTKKTSIHSIANPAWGMRTTKRVILFLFLLNVSFVTHMAQAEVIQIPLAEQGGKNSDAIARPLRGVTQDQVLAQFGQPQAATEAVGNPPISRWEYADFYVVFEYDHVIHSVLKHRPVNDQ